MKTTGNGGIVKKDGVAIAHVISWSYREEVGDIDIKDSRKTAGEISVFFDPNFHGGLVGKVVDISILPSGVMSDQESNYLRIPSCRITAFTPSGGADTLNTASLSFESRFGVDYA